MTSTENEHGSIDYATLSYPRKEEFTYVVCYIGRRKYGNRLSMRLENMHKSERFAALNQKILDLLIQQIKLLKKKKERPNWHSDVGPEAIVFSRRIYHYGREHYYLIEQRWNNRLYTFLKIFPEKVSKMSLDVKPLSSLRLDLEHDDFNRLLPYAELDASNIVIDAELKLEREDSGEDDDDNDDDDEDDVEDNNVDVAMADGNKKPVEVVAEGRNNATIDAATLSSQSLEEDLLILDTDVNFDG